MEISRRNFLTGALALGTVAAAGAVTGCSPQPTSGDKKEETKTTADSQSTGYSFEKAPEPIAESDIKETVEADVVIVGAGWSGIITALSCAQNGLDVAVLEKKENFGTRGGDICAIWSKAMEEQGITREPINDVLRRDMQRYDYNINMPLWMRWWNNSEESMNWLIDIAGRNGMKPAINASSIDPSGIDSMYLGDHSFVVDDFDIYGSEPCAYTVQYGMTLLNPILVKEAEQEGAKFYYNTPAVQLVREDNNSGRVSAAIAQNKDGEYVRFNAKKGVVLCAGDYSGDEEMVKKYTPWALEVRNGNFAEPGYTGNGDGLKMGMWVGGAWQQGDPSGAMICQWGFESLGTSKQAYNCHEGLMVNNLGKRFMCETATQGYVAQSQMHQPGYGIWPIWNDSWADLKTDVPYKQAPIFVTQPELDASYARGMWEKGIEAGTIIKADTLEELISKTSLPKEQTLKTIEEYNACCAAGVDTQFAKNPLYLHALDEGPFYTVAEAVGMPLFYCCMGGLRVNEYNNVLDAEDAPIDGLYATGVMTGGMFCGFYNWALPGHNIGQSLTLGYLLGKHLAEQ